ncbi:CTP synthase [Erwinia sp. MMLR14_017]|uniref:CTP synthase C-terminal region-related (seleno)protein n=1 Tax=Erwinia sp. MMLR14_017 TaxID=3093842 RepID=UPI0029905D7F|nr:CTP synthase [Erwinia sp. MMLR14_017]MDW8845742.1 CTP synthase [Erwinia sp. MMLR14_017]
MNHPLRIALVGDYRATAIAHQAIPPAIQIAAQATGLTVSADWLPTKSINDIGALKNFAAIWVVPGSPYENDAGAFLAITYARENNIPFLGSCGGFQYALVEYARNVMGWADAAHAESQSEGRIVISPLSCSLIEKSGDIRIRPESLIARAYNKLTTQEGYHCNFGVNPEFVSHLAEYPLRITAWDTESDVRGIELPDHKFFVATLFQSERAALRNELSPLVVALLKAAAD